MSSTASGTVCRYYLQAGKCFYGDECKFTHDAGALAVATQAAAVAAAAAAAAEYQNTPQSSPKSSLAAGAKEWTPGGSPVAVQVTSSSSMLNPKKTPFKPASDGTTVAAGAIQAVPFYPGGSWNNQASEFVPAGSMGEMSGYDHHQHEDDTDGAQLHEDFAAMQPYVDDEGNELDDAHQHEHMHDASTHAPSGHFVHPASYMAVGDFASSGVPVGGSDRPAVPAQHAASIGVIRRDQVGIFMDEPLRSRLTHWTHLQTARMQPDEPAFASLPVTLDRERYHSLMPLQHDLPPKGLEASYKTTGGQCVSYKVTSAADGRSYVVKRLPPSACRSEERANELLRPWTDLSAHYGSASAPLSPHAAVSRPWAAGPAHPSILAPRGVFVTKEFGDAATCLVYDYRPTAAALHPPPADSNLPLDTLWSYAVQLVNALAAIHDQGLAADEMLKPGRVLLTNDQRLHLSCCGVRECLSGPLSEADVGRLQQQDFVRLGLLLLGWMGYAATMEPAACIAGPAGDQAVRAVFAGLRPQLVQQYSGDLVGLVSLLMSTPDGGLTCIQVQQAVAHRMQAAYTLALSHTDYVESEMAKEVQNGRLFRLLVKLGFITERPDASGGSWSETGDRYLLSLYRDLVFHSVHGADVPNLDWGHVVHQLNKLDAGDAEKLLLSSRNGESMLLVRYADLKRCVDESYQELWRKQQHGLGREADDDHHQHHHSAKPSVMHSLK